MLVLGLLLAASSALATPKRSKSPCDEGLSQPAAAVPNTSLEGEVRLDGKIDAFDLDVQPKFYISDLIADSANLHERNEKYLIARNHYHEIFIERRLVPLHKEPQVVLVKYLLRRTELSNVFTEEDHLKDLHKEILTLVILKKVLRRLGLLKDFDVMVPIDQGPNYIVFPYVEAANLNVLSADFFRSQGFAKNKKKIDEEFAGPPTPEQNSKLAALWSEQQRRMKRVRRALMRDGAFDAESYNETSWAGVRFLAQFAASHPELPKGMSISLRTEVLVTRDGRFVIFNGL